MKKVIVIVMLFVVAFAANVTAQITAGKPDPSKLEITLQDLVVSSITLRDGSNTIPLPDGRGTIKLVKRGDKFSDVVYTDAAGKAIRLAPNTGSTGNLPKTPCKYKIPDACFGSASQNAVMCMCRPTDLASGPTDPYSIGLLLPAIQKARKH